MPRLYLGVVATSKGLVVGNICYVNSEGVRVDCRLAAGGETIPQVNICLSSIISFHPDT